MKSNAERPPVTLETMRPEQIAARKRLAPTAYLPFGILEWHGLHNPYGLDGLKAHGIACRLAEELGGIAMPPLYWGDHRGEICERHLDAELPLANDDALSWNPADIMCATLDTPRNSFARNAMRSEATGGWRLWEDLAVHAMHQTESYGFKRIVAIPGHYPLLPPLERAIARYREEGGRCAVMVVNDGLYADGGQGDHAAAYETSILMALHPETVDLGRLDPDMAMPLAGVALGLDPRSNASRDYGERALRRLVEDMKQRLPNPL